MRRSGSSRIVDPATHPQTIQNRLFFGGGGEGNEDAVADVVFGVAPADGFAEEAGEPNAEGNEIPGGDQQDFLPSEWLAQAADANTPSDGDAKGEVGAEVREGDRRGRMEGDGGEGPRQSLREEQAEVSPGTHVTHDDHPAKALVEKFVERLKAGEF